MRSPRGSAISVPTATRVADDEREAASPATQVWMQASVAEEVEVLRWCLDWLARLERGE